MKNRLLPTIKGYRILDRYILGKFLSTYLFGLAIIIVIVVVFDYTEKVDDFTETKASLRGIVVDYYLNFIPYFINQFSGLFTFISVIFFTSKMASQTEIVAILSGGVSFNRFLWPYFMGATGIAAISFALSLWVIPVSQRDCVEFQRKHIKRNMTLAYDPDIYRQIDDGTYAYVRGYSPNLERIPYFAIDRFDGSSMVEQLDAAGVTFDPETRRWSAPRYTIRRFVDGDEISFKQYRNLDTLINLDARELGHVESLIKTMTIGELNDFLAQQRKKGADDVYIIEVERHARFSYPFSAIILTLIGVSLSSRKVRGGMGFHIGMGIALCFAYIMCGRVFERIAMSGSLPAWFGVWLPNIIFAVIAVVIYYKAPK